MIDPACSSGKTKDWTGKPIKRMTFNENPAGYKNAKGRYCYGLGKLIAEGLNYLTGGTGAQVRLDESPPGQIDYLIGPK